MKESKQPSRAQWGLVLLILSLAAARLGYMLLTNNGLKETAALFVGLPAIIALIIALTPQAKSVTGMVLKATTIALLLALISLQEGGICILMAAPLFYAVALVIGLLLDIARREQKGIYGFLLLPILLLSSLEGTHESLAFNRANAVSVSRVVPAPEWEVTQTLAQTPAWTRPLPLFFRLGFPVPDSAAGHGLAVGDRRVVSFTNGHQAMGQMQWEIMARGTNSVRFQAAADSTPIAGWLTWQAADVQWTAVDATHTLVTWTITYERQLDPAWYFAPLERYGVGLAADYLLATFFPSES